MPKFLEHKLKKEYPNNPGAVYGTMNKLGYMKGNKETAKGKSMEKKHEAKTKALEGKKEGHPVSSFKGKHKFVNSETKKPYEKGIYGGMNIHEAMDFEKRRKEKEREL